MIQIPEMAMSLYMLLKNWLFDNGSFNASSTRRVSQEEPPSMNERIDNIESKLSIVVVEVEKIANSITLFQNSK